MHISKSITSNKYNILGKTTYLFDLFILFSEPRKLANLAVVEGTSSSVTITWDHQIIDFTNADFIVEYSCDNWATIQNTRAPSPSVTIEGLNYFPASYKIRVRTQIFDTFLNYRNEGPNSEPLECKIFGY